MWQIPKFHFVKRRNISNFRWSYFQRGFVWMVSPQHFLQKLKSYYHLNHHSPSFILEVTGLAICYIKSLYHLLTNVYYIFRFVLASHFLYGLWGVVQEGFSSTGNIMFNYLVCSASHKRAIDLKTRTTTTSQRLLWLLLVTGKNWPITDRRIPSNDPRNNCRTHFGPSSPRFQSGLWYGVFVEKRTLPTTTAP